MRGSAERSLLAFVDFATINDDLVRAGRTLEPRGATSFAESQTSSRCPLVSVPNRVYVSSYFSTAAS
jgi:hypothetical protein